MKIIKEPRSMRSTATRQNLRGISDHKEFCLIQIRSLTPRHAKHCRTAEPTGNALAIAVQSFMMTVLFVMLFPLLAPAAEGIQTLAILPFDNNSITEPEKYAPLSNGLAAMLITDLNKNDSVLTVIERNKIKSILKEIALGQLGGVDQSTAIEAGKILGAQSIAFGSFTIMGDMIRMDVRIIKVESSELVMAESVSGETKNFMALEMDLATKIANALKTRLKELPGKSKSSIAAALYFSKGIDAMDKGNKKEAQKLFNKAIELDPTYKIQVQAIN